MHRTTTVPNIAADIVAPMPSTSPHRSMAARIAANTRWAHTTDRTAATAAARAGLEAKFEREVDPEHALSSAERSRRAEHARRAYFVRLALLSAQARRRKSDSSSR